MKQDKVKYLIGIAGSIFFSAISSQAMAYLPWNSASACSPISSSSTQLSRSNGNFYNNSTSTLEVVCPLLANPYTATPSVLVNPNSNPNATLQCRYEGVTTSGTTITGAYVNAVGSTIQTLTLAPNGISASLAVLQVRCKLPGTYSGVSSRLYNLGGY